jgi:hypothetical protein
MYTGDYQSHQSLKICYWGPSLSGKTFALTAMKIMKALEDPTSVFDFVTVANKDTGRTVFFDQAVFGFGKNPKTNDYIFKIHVFTTAGQKRLKDTRKVVLQGIDGLVLFIDGSLERWDENIWSLKELLKLKGESIRNKNIPYTIFVNKQDLPWGTKISIRHIDHLFNSAGVDKLFPIREDRLFNGSSKLAKKDLELLLRKRSKFTLLDQEGLFRRQFRPKSFNPLMKSLETVVKLTIKTKYR